MTHFIQDQLLNKGLMNILEKIQLHNGECWTHFIGLIGAFDGLREL